MCLQDMYAWGYDQTVKNQFYQQTLTFVVATSKYKIGNFKNLQPGEVNLAKLQVRLKNAAKD
jgi:hypothetical protein